MLAAARSSGVSELGCMAAESQASLVDQSVTCHGPCVLCKCRSPHACVHTSPPTRRYPSGESYMDVIQRLEPVVTGEGGW